MRKNFSIFAIALLISSKLFAGEIEPGLYFAQDLEGGEIKAEIKLNEDLTVNFRIATSDYTMPAPGCGGNYEVYGDMLTASMTCPDTELGNLKVVLDIKNVNPTSVRSPEGAKVEVTIDLIGDKPMPFTVKKIDQSVFPK